MATESMWIVVAGSGIAYIGRDSPKAIKGHFWTWAVKSLGYPPVFKEKADAILFARRARRSKSGKQIKIVEVEFYKGELNG